MALDPSLERALSRRRFLGRGLAAAGGLVTARGRLGGALAQAAGAAPNPRPTSRSSSRSDLTRRRQPQRLVFALSHGGRQAASSTRAGPRSRSGSAAPAARGRALKPTASTAPGSPRAGASTWRGRPSTSAGVWRVEARAQGQKVPFTLQVNDAPVTVVPGMPAPRAASPTTTDTLGVDPICTREPLCPLHTLSLATVIGAGKPVAALFATPARCQSQYCAPVLDEFLDVIKGYGDRIVPVHTEIYQGTDRHRARADRRRVAHRRASRGCSASTAPAPSSRASTARSAATR